MFFLWGVHFSSEFRIFAVTMEVRIKETEIIEAAQKGMDAFVELFRKATLDAVGGELNQKTMEELNADQITLLAYEIVREEVMDGGFIQLIHNGYGPFIFLNPFAKAVRLWGAHDLSKLIYKGRKLFEKYSVELTAECTDDEFMALFERYPEFDDLDDELVENEEEWTELIAHYIDEHLDAFAIVE